MFAELNPFLCCDWTGECPASSCQPTSEWVIRSKRRRMENALLHLIIITIMYIYHVLINALTAHMVVVVFLWFFVVVVAVFCLAVVVCNSGFITVIA